MSHTIYALASGVGRAGVAVIRLSGGDAFAVAEKLTKKPLPEPRTTAVRNLYHPKTGAFLDDVLIIPFKAPASYTGEDVIEIHAHGGRAVLQSLFDALSHFDTIRMAEAGEYTQRAFKNGKMDLTEAEGIIDLIEAETEAQRKQALRQSRGALGKMYTAWADDLVPVLAHLEAFIDFPDEEIPDDVFKSLKSKLQTISTSMTEHLNDNHAGERLRQGIKIAIFGPPNAGKSSLLNILAKRDAAIVSDTAGTTRDVIEVQLDIGGYPVTVADTAGIRTTTDSIESEGVKRALFTTETADFKLLVLDATDGDSYNNARGDITPHIDNDTYVLLNKCDQDDTVLNADTFKISAGTLVISVKTGQGIDSFFDHLQTMLDARIGLTDTPLITRSRHRDALLECMHHIDRSLDAPVIELMAEDIRLAVRALGRITGKVDVEDLLDIVFRDFCIGK